MHDGKGEQSLSLILITGGVRSGKSKFAEELAVSHSSSVLYVATGVNVDGEMDSRIRLHQERRPAEWGLVESTHSLIQSFGGYHNYEVVLLDCLSTWISNRLLEVPEESYRDPATTERILSEWKQWITNVQTSYSGRTIVVSTEAGLGGVAMTRLGRWFQDVLGEGNQIAAQEADEVYAVMSGIPWRLKG
jgi:adenosylcobinamide kinase/adenosylcobinamide-phosphate guanylyltransferase